MAVWFIRKNSAWHRAENAPCLATAEVETTAAGKSVLLAPPGGAVVINGVPLRTGIHLLQHRDEVATADGTIAYFSGEAPPEVESFPRPSAKCGRCRGAISEGAAAVKCTCGVWYHHSDPPCFEYGDNPLCVACRKPTRLDGSGLWEPEEAEWMA